MTAVILITHITVVHRQMGRSKDGTTLTATIGITLHGGEAAGESRTVHISNDHMRLAEDIVSRRITDFSIVIAYIAFPTAAIDISTGTSLDVGISRSGETSGIVGSIIGTHAEEIVYRTSGTGSIDIF